MNFYLKQDKAILVGPCASELGAFYFKRVVYGQMLVEQVTQKNTAALNDNCLF